MAIFSWYVYSTGSLICWNIFLVVILYKYWQIYCWRKIYSKSSFWRPIFWYGAYRLSSSWKHFTDECDRLRTVFVKLKYPEHLVDSTIASFVTSKTAKTTSHTDQDTESPVRIVLPFKDQKSADKVRKQLKDLSHKIQKELQPVFTSTNIKSKLFWFVWTFCKCVSPTDLADKVSCFKDFVCQERGVPEPLEPSPAHAPA